MNYAYLIVDTVLVDKLINPESIPEGYIESSVEYDGTCTSYVDGNFVPYTPQTEPV